MFDIGWTELLVVGIVALIVVGPKDLPILFRRMGEFTGKAKAMAREFSRAMDDAADQAGVKDIQTSLKAATNPKQFGLDAINKAAKDLELPDDPLADTPAAKSSGAKKPAATGTPKTPPADTATPPEETPAVAAADETTDTKPA
ncbi:MULTISPECIES: Sec-independent protein translocase protein TatB [unclassified Meridianimarinicoccus]|uniref:Sec-independent protein translocase protein TatB n=1 Tax=unclassified Meridianimarinicoccus TaxID=2923344 RepID=UPI0018685305|nr:Sec-independent protein translocase protein TatB [Fluviibacterium sp. MJW13]